MLRGLHVPSDLPSLDLAPDITASEKLHAIATAPVTIVHHSDYEFDLQIPYIRDTAFVHSLPSMVESLTLERINLGDKALYGYGIGSRLLRAATRFAVGLNSDITLLIADDHPRLGVLNTFISVFGEGNVEARIGGISYGGQGNNTLEQIFDDQPFQEGKPYLLSVVTARIDPASAMRWEIPVK